MIEFPTSGAAATRMLRIEKLKQIIAVIVQTWEPDWVRISSYEMDQAVHPQEGYRGQRVGWLTFVSNRYGQLPSLPELYQVSRAGELGSVILAGSAARGRMRAAEVTDVEILKQLSVVLERAAMLAPLPN